MAAKPRIDLSGRRFGLLVAVEPVHVLVGKLTPKLRVYWKCRCDCGGVSVVDGRHLRLGNTASCGCRLGGTSAPGVAAANGIYASYAANARKNGIPFALSREEFMRIMQKPCAYCGTPPSAVALRRPRGGPYVYNGLDRIDGPIGYVTGNVAPCCRPCNFMKGTITREQFIRQCLRVAAHQTQLIHAVA